jgi:hypothetical protein
VVRQLKLAWPQVRCLVLAHTSRQQQQAQAAGADRVLRAGFSAGAFFNTVQELSTSSATTTPPLPT